MKKILDNPSYVNRDGYNGLDLSHSVTFTSSCAHILPVMWDFLQPGDKVKLQSNLLTRTSPLLSSAFAQVEQNVKFYFVPISQLYKPFEQTFNGIQDFGSDFYSSYITDKTISEMIPHCSLGNLIDSLLSWIRPPLPDDNILVDSPSLNFFRRLRLIEAIGIPVSQILRESFVGSTTTTWRNHMVNLLPFMAYQKIWYDYFRDADRIPNDPEYYNADSYVDGSAVAERDRLRKFTTLQMCPNVKDIVNNLYVSPLFGQQGVGGDDNMSLTEVNQWLSNVTLVAPIDSSSALDSNMPTTVTTPEPISVANLRAAFAANKLLEITRRAKKHYDAQILAHFGVDVPTGVDGECFELGGKSNMLDIGAVISQAATSDASLGEIGGRGYGSATSDIVNFEAKTHGILMAVYYSRPYYNYEQLGIDKKLLYTRVSDFPRLEYENLGNQPVFRMNQVLETSQINNSEVFDWQYRYSEVKDKPSLSLFGMQRTLKAWNITRNMMYKDYWHFYCLETALNNILELPYSNEWRYWEGAATAEQTNIPKVADENNASAFDTDPFQHQLRLSYQKSTKLSTYGIQEI